MSVGLTINAAYGDNLSYDFSRDIGPVASFIADQNWKVGQGDQIRKYQAGVMRLVRNVRSANPQTALVLCSRAASVQAVKVERRERRLSDAGGAGGTGIKP
jgi:hypothetical protein